MIERRIAVLGAGAWGTALAITLSRGGRRVSLCVRRPAQLEAMARARENRAYLPGVKLPPELDLAIDWRAAAAQADVILAAIPSAFLREMVAPIAPVLRPGTTLVSATKGIEAGSLATMTQALGQSLPPSIHIAALSGPGFAMEVAHGKPAALVVAAREDETAILVQRLLAVPFLRVYRSSDVIGVEVGGAVKNVIAIAAGISEGLDLGSSACAALITRGLAEMMRLGIAMGGRRETLAGLSGLGDLVLTCTGKLSRNRAYGISVGSGARKAHPDELPAEGSHIAEGVSNARLIQQLGMRLGVELPIVAAVCECLYEDRPPKAMVERLFSRELKAEF